VGVASFSYATAQAAPTATLAIPSTQNVIVMLANQHLDLGITKGKVSPRVQANRQDQSSLIASAKSHGARNLRGFDSINAFAASASPDQLRQLAADPSVAAIVPDLPISKPAALDFGAGGPSASKPTPAALSTICPSDPAKPLLEPEALQVTNTAFLDPATPQAQNIVDGTGVKVGWIADGIDINNPDFIRANGQHVFVDYQDFSGDGLAAVTGGAEAFGDASDIAAQGRQTYDLSQFVNPAHALPPGCTITVRGVAPGASLVGLKVFGNANTAPTSRFIQAIDYAVNVAGVDVLNQSFGANPFPDTENDPIALADEAAVAAGVTVVASTGDAGTNGTQGSPSTNPDVISVAATTTFRSYAQTTNAGFQLSNGKYVDNNISSLSSGGISHSAQVPDLAAPGDLGWALCTPNLALYEECTADGGGPASVQNFGGTSMSSPLTSGAAALVIEAYEKTHGGVRPAPSLVKRLLTSTATDLGHPAFEQGAGLLNSLAAVKAAMSWKDGNGAPALQGSSLVVDKPQLSFVGDPGSGPVQTLQVRNVTNQTQIVHAATRTIGNTVSSTSGTVALDTATAPFYVDAFGIKRSFATTTFTIPSGSDRLDVSFAVPTPGFATRVILLDPSGTYVAYSIPQGANNFGHVDVRFPVGGTYTAIFALSKGTGFSGTFQWLATTSNFTTSGQVFPSTLVLPAGATGAFVVHPTLPKTPGDVSASVQLSTNSGITASVPMTLRAVVPGRNTTWQGTITGGNGRQAGGVAQSNVFFIDVPKGKRDIAVSVTFPDPNMLVFGLLTAPDGQVYSFQPNVTPDGSALMNGLQMFRRDPQAGRWIFSLEVTNPVSGLEISQPFTATVAFNTVDIKADFPDNAKRKLAAGVPVNIPVQVTNTGVVPLTFFADGRLDQTGQLNLAELSGAPAQIPLPVPANILPFWLVPPDSTQLAVTATADQPVNMDVFYQSGDPDHYSPANGNGSVVKFNAKQQVAVGLFVADIGQTGPFNGPAPSGTVSVSAAAQAQLFDPGFDSTTGDIWLAGVDSQQANTAMQARIKQHALSAMLKPGFPAKAANLAKAGSGSDSSTPPTPTGPVVLNPGETTTITVTITPSAPVGTVVTGHAYIDTFSFFTDGGDELIDFPYAYTVG
jgi:subtilisin family serine protease